MITIMIKSRYPCLLQIENARHDFRISSSWLFVIEEMSQLLYQNDLWQSLHIYKFGSYLTLELSASELLSSSLASALWYVHSLCM